MPERIQLSRKKGWRKPENTVVVARPSKWGNLPDPAELAGKNLACWCPLPAPGEPDICHAAVLLELANTTEGNTPRSQTDRTEP